MQQPILGCLSQRMEALLCFTMPCILDDDQRIVEEDTFRFGLTDVMFVRTLAAVAIVPVKTRDLFKVDHSVYDQYIQTRHPMQYAFFFGWLRDVLRALVLTAALLLPPSAVAADSGFTQFI